MDTIDNLLFYIFASIAIFLIIIVYMTDKHTEYMAKLGYVEKYDPMAREELWVKSPDQYPNNFFSPR